MAAHGVSRKKSRVVGEPVKTLFGPWDWDAPNYVTPIMVIITTNGITIITITISIITIITITIITWDVPNYVTPIMVIIAIKVNIIKCSEITVRIAKHKVLEQPICFHLDIYISRQKPRIKPVGVAFSKQAEDTSYNQSIFVMKYFKNLNLLLVCKRLGGKRCPPEISSRP